jgi:antitoxin (DNA-binding transcriptional repressor) of toxin-antitoxin stability system
MKAITVSELKAHLSRYLRIAARGGRIIVKDRDDPIAQLGPPPPQLLSWHERLAQAGRLRLGTQNWSALRVSAAGRGADIQGSLRAVREDRSEVRRR